MKKKKLNTKSSTKAELIGADNAMPQMLWTRYFLEAQVYGINNNILYQENMSAIILENNGKTSSTGKYETHYHALLLHKLSDRNWRRSNRTYPDRVNVWGPFHKAIARCTVKFFQGRTNEYTRWPGHGINGHGQKWLNKDDHV